LKRHQTASGGFSDLPDDNNPTAAATSDAIFLSSLFNLNRRIDVPAATQFLNDLHRKDGGYAASPSEAASTLEATHDVIAALALLSPERDFSDVYPFLKQTLNPTTGFASSRPGEPTSLEATVAWFEIHHLLDRNDVEAQTAIATLKHFLADRQTELDRTVFFEDSAAGDLTPMAFNSLAIRLAYLIGYDIPKDQLRKWANYMNEEQDSESGCYHISHDASEFTLSSTLHAVHALYTLQRISGSNQLARTDLRSLQNCAAGLAPKTLTGATDGHRILALSNFFGHYFTTKPTFEADGHPLAEGNAVIQGQSLSAVLSISTEFGANWLLDAVLVVENADFQQVLEFRYIPDRFFYQTVSPLDTSALIGPLTVSFSFEKTFPLLGKLSFARRDQLLVGYGLEVTPDARHLESGTQIVPGAAVPTGTSFFFTLRLFTATQNELTSGAFNVGFKITDSSGTLLHADSIDAQTSPDAFTFGYTLTRPASLTI
jgi:hypothetical protein